MLKDFGIRFLFKLCLAKILFEHKKKRTEKIRTGCSAVGSALGSGPRGRGFKSRHSDQRKR